jgi:hypothetical protein
VQSFGLPPEAAGGPGFDAVGPGKWPAAACAVRAWASRAAERCRRRDAARPVGVVQGPGSVEGMPAFVAWRLVMGPVASLLRYAACRAGIHGGETQRSTARPAGLHRVGTEPDCAGA